MESVLFKGAYVPGQGNVDVGVRGGRIDLVGRGEAGNYDRVIAADNCALLPGFVNAHGHAAMTLLRSAAGRENLAAGGQAQFPAGILGNHVGHCRDDPQRHHHLHRHVLL